MIITLTKTTIQITVYDPDPERWRKDIMKAIAASFRWKASSPEDYTGDSDNLVVLAQFLEQLTEQE